MKYLLIMLPLVVLSGCGVLNEIVDNGQAIVEGATRSFSEVGMAGKVVAAVTAPSILSWSEVVLAAAAVVTGGAAGWVGVKKGHKLANGNGNGNGK